MEILHAMLPPGATYADKRLHDLVVLRMANLSLEHGHCDVSPMALAELSMAIGPRFGHYSDGFRFGHLGAALAERDDFARFRGKVCCVVAYHVLPWTRAIQAASSMMQRALDLASGDRRPGIHSVLPASPDRVGSRIGNPIGRPGGRS